MKTTKKVYIGGPVTGLQPEECKVLFEAGRNIAMRLETDAYGFPVCITPQDVCHDDWDWITSMRACIDAIFSCDVIYFLPGWVSSKGANVEHSIARNRRIKIVYIDKYMLEKELVEMNNIVK